MRLETQINEKGEMLIIIPKSASIGLVSVLRRNLKIKAEYRSITKNLVFVIGD